MMYIFYSILGVQIIDENRFDFLWVTDFPLFLPREEGGNVLFIRVYFILKKKKTHTQ